MGERKEVESAMADMRVKLDRLKRLTAENRRLAAETRAVVEHCRELVRRHDWSDLWAWRPVVEHGRLTPAAPGD